jgi:hypothetical protein
MKYNLKQPFELRGKSRVTINWSVGNFSFHFKGTLSQEERKTNFRRQICSKITLAGQSDFEPKNLPNYHNQTSSVRLMQSRHMS